MTDLPEHLLEGFLRTENTSYKAPTHITVKDHYTNTSSMDGFLRDLQGGKSMTMKEVIDDIEELIAIREKLQQEVFRDVAGVLQDINNFLTASQDKIPAIELLKLKEKLLDIEEFKMQEKINAFRDIALLKKELRDRVAEFKDRENRIGVLDDLLGEPL